MDWVRADAARQGVIEMFLGLQMAAHFPSVQLVYPDTPLPMDEDSDFEDAPEEPALPDTLKVPCSCWALYSLHCIPIFCVVAELLQSILTAEISQDSYIQTVLCWDDDAGNYKKNRDVLAFDMQMAPSLPRS